MAQRQYRIGLVINPWAGLGGSVALKGSDGAATVAEALALGAKPQAGKRVAEALSLLANYAAQLHFVTAAGNMGAQVCDQLGFHYTSVYQPVQSTSDTPSDTLNNSMTTAADTQAAVTAICAQGVDLLLFAGGDGTARDVCAVYPPEQPVLGIPAGVKIHSGVYAISPKAAGRVVELLVTGQLASLLTADVMDIDEAAFRGGTVRAKRYGEMRVPAELRYVQAVKMGGREADELVLADIAADIIERMDDRVDDISGTTSEPLWIMGSGSTVAAIMEELQLPNTLLGVDVVQAGQVIAADVTAAELAQLTGQHQHVSLVVTLIGGQGHIFGRGNQQLSPQVIRRVTKEHLYVVATKQKLQELSGRPLLVDTGDAELDEELAGFIRVITGYHDEVMLTIAAVE